MVFVELVHAIIQLETPALFPNAFIMFVGIVGVSFVAAYAFVLEMK